MCQAEDNVFRPNRGLLKVKFGLMKKSNLIYLVHGNQIKPNLTIEFCVCNLNFQNSNKFECIRP